MSALSAHLMTLLALDMARIGLRVNLAADFVSCFHTVTVHPYFIGSM